MTWTSIATYVTGQLITATIANQQWGGNLNHVASMTANGGNALSALSSGTSIQAPVTTAGDIGYYDGSAWQRLAIGSNGQSLGVSGGALAYINPGLANYVQVRASANVNLPISSTTKIAWDLEDFDTAAYHDIVSNTTRLTVPAGLAGKYLVYAFGATNGPFALTPSLIVNNTSVYNANSFTASGSIYSPGGIVILLNLSEADYIEFQIANGSGSTAGTLYGGTTGARLGMVYLG